MKRTTVKLPNDLESVETRRPAGWRRRLLAADAGQGGRSDVSERIEEILAAEIER